MSASFCERCICLLEIQTGTFIFICNDIKLSYLIITLAIYFSRIFLAFSTFSRLSGFMSSNVYGRQSSFRLCFHSSWYGKISKRSRYLSFFRNLPSLFKCLV